MPEENQPVDVICMCSANGDIRPLRFRLEGKDHALLRVDICEIISVKPVQFVGIEAHVFLCRAWLGEKLRLFELKYTFRTHTWSLLREIC